jgi:polyisoprenoid-binding protein YceI
MRTLPLIAAAALAAPLAFAQPLDLAQSRIGFTLKQLNVPVDGKFKQFNAKVDFDPAKPQTGKADITISTASIDLPTSDANEEARKKDWFNVAQYPTARFISTSIKPLAAGRFQVAGKLTLKGVTRDVSVPFTSKAQNGLTVVEGMLPISRLTFKIGEGEWSDTGTVDETVQIKFRLALKGA